MATLQDISYTIVALDKSTGAIHVNYKTAAYPPGLVYQIDLPIDATTGALPDATALDALIKQNAPVGQLTDVEPVYAFEQERKQLAAKADFTAVESLVVAPVITTPVQPTVVGATTL